MHWCYWRVSRSSDACCWETRHDFHRTFSCVFFPQPPKNWVRAELESKELLTFCLKRLKGLNKVSSEKHRSVPYTQFPGFAILVYLATPEWGTNHLLLYRPPHMPLMSCSAYSFRIWGKQNVRSMLVPTRMPISPMICVLIFNHFRDIRLDSYCIGPAKAFLIWESNELSLQWIHAFDFLFRSHSILGEIGGCWIHLDRASLKTSEGVSSNPSNSQMMACL